MKLAALILAHRHPNLLGKLTARLTRAGINSYVHIDAKIDQAPFEYNCQNNQVVFLPRRLTIYWGGYSMIEALILLAQTALRDEQVTHFLHISGDTYPIKSDQNLFTQLTQNLDWIDVNEFKEGTVSYKRIANLYLPDTRIGGLRGIKSHEERYLSEEMVNNLADIHRAYQIKTTTKFPWRFAKGANWWCLRRETLKKCLNLIQEQRAIITTWFRYSANPDESLFNTLMLNFFEKESRKPCPIFTIWNVMPAPYEFKDLTDLDKINKSSLPLARKFAEHSSALIEYLDQQQI